MSPWLVTFLRILRHSDLLSVQALLGTPPLQLPGVTYNYLMMLCGGPWQAPHKTN